ncbi:hypothetical protein [Thaumasiovibrio sp. DFM-14]|uniref:hypothetical protein n=1 Tax=Thaumasiovibrio sp. DFM-14 TaxID=3384792 RepID=UPI0039A0EC76
MRRIVLSFIMLTIMSGCATVQEETRISTDLRASEYNSIAAKYMVRPTFTSLEKFSTGETVLAVSMDSYKTDSYGNSTNTNRYLVDYADEYIALIGKYIEWESLAINRQDAFTKDIGKATAWSNGASASLKFSFHSGNEYKHYLSVSFCTTVCLDEQAHYYTKKDAIELKKLLAQMKTGKINFSDIDSVYN